MTIVQQVVMRVQCVRLAVVIRRYSENIFDRIILKSHIHRMPTSRLEMNWTDITGKRHSFCWIECAIDFCISNDFRSQGQALKPSHLPNDQDLEITQSASSDLELSNCSTTTGSDIVSWHIFSGKNGIGNNIVFLIYR